MSAIVQNQIEDRINAFKSDIGSLLPIQVVRKHVIYGNCCVLSEDLYFDLRSEVAERFRLHPNEVLVVGSAKLGFSIAPHKRYRHFGDESDIDVVLVSPTLFDEIWEATFAYWRDGGYWEQERDFKEYLFRGWIRPDKLPPASTFSMCSDWWEFFRALTNGGKYGYYKIAGALYKSWYYLEDYQEICAKGCKQELLGE
jgi:predicted nucleotidyltransferase